MDTQQLLKIVTTVLEDTKAKDIKILDVSRISNFADLLVIASGQSNRQVRALAERIIEQVKIQGHPLLGEEGRHGGEWVLVDLGTIVVHLMQPQIRDFYELEKLWGDARETVLTSHYETTDVSALESLR